MAASYAILLIGCLLAGAHAYTYPLTTVLSPEEGGAYTISEGPMFRAQDAPFGSLKPYIQVNITIKPDGFAGVDDEAYVHVVFYDDITEAVLGVSDEGRTAYCCTPSLVDQGLCLQPGNVILSDRAAIYAGGRPTVHSVLIADASSQFVSGTASTSCLILTDVSTVQASFEYEVMKSIVQSVLLIRCPIVRASSEWLPITLDATISFHNPYGFVPGLKWAEIPLSIALVVIYGLLLAVYSTALLYHRKHLLPLQIGVWAVVLLTLIHSAIEAYSVHDKNVDGSPPCCPVSKTTLASVVVELLQQTLSRGMLLAVCCGFGVVRRHLDRTTSLAITGLMIAYLVFGINSAVRVAITYDNAATIWEVPVLLLNIIYLAFLFVVLSATIAGLQSAGETAKLKMYTRLLRTMQVFVNLFVAVALLGLLLQLDFVPLGWEYLWIVPTFWHVLYLGILLAVMWIWAPGPMSYQYAWYTQAGQNMEDDDGDIEMAGTQLRQGMDTDSDGEMDGRLGFRALAAGGQGTRGDVLDELEITFSDDDGGESDSDIGRGAETHRRGGGGSARDRQSNHAAQGTTAGGPASGGQRGDVSEGKGGAGGGGGMDFRAALQRTAGASGRGTGHRAAFGIDQESSDEEGTGVRQV